MAFIEDCLYTMNQFFNGWQTNEKFYMIPPSPIDKFQGPTDPNASGYNARIDAAMKSGRHGHAAEMKVLQWFEKSKPPGFLIQGFNPRNLCKQLQRSDEALPEKIRQVILNPKYKDVFKKKQQQGKDQESDLILIHPKYGLCVLEIKATQKPKSKKYKATKQQKTRVTFFTDLYHVVRQCYPDEKPFHDIDKLIQTCKCYPNVQATTENQPSGHQGEGSKKKKKKQKKMEQNSQWSNDLRKNHLESPENFELWLDNFQKAEPEISLFELKSFRVFTSLLVGFRSAVELSEAVNVMEICKCIDKQEFYKRDYKLQKKHFIHKNQQVEKMTLHDMRDTDLPGKQFFFLNQDQLAVWSKPAVCQVFGGCPGTGKTLLIQQKALECAKSGRKVLVVVPETLAPKYQKFFGDFSSSFKISPNVVALEYLIKYKDLHKMFGEADLFFDEFQTLFELDTYNESVNEKLLGQQRIIEMLVDRGRGNKFTMISCMSSTIQPNYSSSKYRHYDVEGMQNGLQKLQDANYSLTTMNTIVRGTTRITGHWKSGFERLKGDYGKTFSGPIVQGHSVTGPQVLEKVVDQQDVCSEVFETISNFMESARAAENRTKHFLRPKDIAVLCDETEWKSEIGHYLQDKQFEVGSVVDQVSNPQLIAVDMADNCPSYEWVLVIFIQCSSLSGYFTPPSRAIVELHVFEIEPKGTLPSTSKEGVKQDSHS